MNFCRFSVCIALLVYSTGIEEIWMSDFQRLLREQDGYPVYWAGLPHFPRNFTRDGIVAGLLAEDVAVLRSQLVYSAAFQGTRADAVTGEEVGKIFHERPGVQLRGLLTTFNACDTTALWLIGHRFYREMTGDDELVREHRDAISRAAEYVVAHVRDGFFLEDPAFVGADRFALRVTYWKDSVLFGRPEGEPVYPVLYSLAHVVNLCGLRAAAALLEVHDYDSVIDSMASRVQELLSCPGELLVARDACSSICVPSSDWLHALFYLEPGDVPAVGLRSIEDVALLLETPLGYRSLGVVAAMQLPDQYHGDAVWSYEQAVIHAGACRFGLDRLAEVSARIVSRLEDDPELFTSSAAGEWRAGGSAPQLWTVAARQYFARVL